MFLEVATQAVSSNDGFLPDHWAQEVESEPDRAAEEAEEAEVGTMYMLSHVCMCVICMYVCTVCMYIHEVYQCYFCSNTVYKYMYGFKGGG